MSVTHGEQTARSVALEQAYVHEVYEQCAEKTAQTRHWPSIYKFLEELEPGALVCDIGCGDGKYLNANKNIFNVGGDRCKRLTDIAREKENEVLVCDNLSLPFRDESFDAVLSIAVIHHFATTERRVNALKELARVLRIGGKLVISVWAMEQHHRKFESQDVLVPWPKAYCLNTTCNGATSGMPCMKRIRDSSQKGCILRSKQSNRGKNRNKNHWNDPMYSSSPSTSSLSSPNETCYSFFRRALQKLAGGKRNSSNRPWFLESFHSVNGGGGRGSVTGGGRSDSVSDVKNNRHHNYCDQSECGDIDDIPIELRRLEDEIVTLNKQTDTFSIKSKSLTDILEIQRSSIVRSRSSIPGLCSSTLTTNSNDKLLTAYKPRLVKQKTHLIDDTCLEVPEDTAIRELIKDLPEFQINAHQSLSAKRANVQKQSSMNEEFMSIERLVERESVRKNIMKQASLSEDIICKRRTFENLKDSLSSGNATRRFQLLKNGLTKRLQQSSMGMDKVSGISLKNGFVKILQGWKSSDSEPEYLDENIKVSELIKNNINERTVQMFDKKDCDTIERRLSREDGSDSSKDSSLQSDTSVDSEDSFASVIYVPKQEIPPLIDVPSGYQLRTTSAPPSPRIKHPPDLHGPRLKLISISPLLKQFPATSKSLPPPSPPGLSPRTINLYNSRPFFGPNYHINQHLTYTFDKLPSKPEAGSSKSENLEEEEEKPVNLLNTQKHVDIEKVQEEIKEEKIVKQEIEIKKNIVKNVDFTEDLNLTTKKKKPNLAICRGYKSMSATVDQEDLPSTEDSVPLLSASEAPERFISEPSNDESRKSRLNQIKELLKQKPGFATRTSRYSKSAFPLVRRASTASTGRLETATRTLPRLLSLELFNPETDDLDSDSSGVSSPESVGSVISVISDERFLLNRIAMTTTKSENPSSSEINKTVELSTSPVKNNNTDDDIKSETITTAATTTTTTTTTSSQSLRLLEAAASVASSLEDAVSRVIRVRSRSQDSHESDETINNDVIKSLKKTKVDNYLKETDKIKKTEDKKWNDECHKHLIDFTGKLSENLINDIDKYCKEKKLEFNSDNDLLMSKKNKGKNDISLQNKRDCKYTQLVDNTIAWLKSSTGDNDFSEYDNKLIPLENQLEVNEDIVKDDNEISLCHFDDSVASKSQDVNFDSVIKIIGTEVEKNDDDDDDDDVKDSKSCLRFGGSVESSDIGDSTETTVSISDDSTNTRRFCSGSTASLGSSNIGYKSLKEKRKHMYTKKSASEDTKNKRYGRMTSSNISGSSSQESLSSDRGGGGGGAITYHQYYHVFREGELDQLINKYVENLHIISSYYDHASWCIVAEKVQVWTI